MPMKYTNASHWSFNDMPWWYITEKLRGVKGLNATYVEDVLRRLHSLLVYNFNKLAENHSDLTMNGALIKIW